jgi:hypothetical protein
MRSRYRFQFPIGIHIYKWGVNVWLQQPIVWQYIAPPSKPGKDGITIFLGMYEEEE